MPEEGAAPSGGKKFDPKAAAASFFAGNKRIPKSSFYGYLFSGIAVDVAAFWLPGAGDVFIVFCRGMYWLNGYKTDKMGMATAIDMAIEAVPILSALPSATAFVVWSYAVNVAETTKIGSTAAGSALRNKAVVSGAERLEAIQKDRTSRQGSLSDREQRKEAQKERMHSMTGTTPSVEEAKKSAGSRYMGNAKNAAEGESALQSFEKHDGSHEGKSVDGMNRHTPPGEQRTTGYQPTQPVFKQKPGQDNRNTNPEHERIKSMGYADSWKEYLDRSNRGEFDENNPTDRLLRDKAYVALSLDNKTKGGAEAFDEDIGEAEKQNTRIGADNEWARGMNERAQGPVQPLEMASNGYTNDNPPQSEAPRSSGYENTGGTSPTDLRSNTDLTTGHQEAA